MLAGNKFTENVCTLRLLTEELLHSILSSDICTFNDIRNVFSGMVGNSRTAHLWIDSSNDNDEVYPCRERIRLAFSYPSSIRNGPIVICSCSP